MQSGVKMRRSRRPARDPRTVARDIPGFSEVLFPQLTPGVVVHLNKRIRSFTSVKAVPDEMIDASNLDKAMLFEMAFARGQQILTGGTSLDWQGCLDVAIVKQSKHFDVRIPESLSDVDIEVADLVGRNLAHMIAELRTRNLHLDLQDGPRVAGYQWISSSEGDFSIGRKLIEVKCTNRRFGAADYRQVLMYWLLSYAASIERGSSEWSHCILLNPRLNHVVEIPFDEIIGFAAAGRSKIELLELFAVVVGDYGLRASSDFEIYG